MGGGILKTPPPPDRIGLTESPVCKPQIAMLLFQHGFDLVKPMCALTSAKAIITSILCGPLVILAQYIRIPFDSACGCASPFEASVRYNRQYAAVIFLMSGCSSGVFSTHKFKTKPCSKLVKLMKEWNVYDNNVMPLMKRCRSVILIHLSPRADMKIEKLPIPTCLVKFLSIPELDNLVDECNKAVRS